MKTYNQNHFIFTKKLKRGKNMNRHPNIFTTMCRIVVENTRRIIQRNRRNAYLRAERIERVPVHTSVLTGMEWVHELIQGHPFRIKNQFRMSAPVFLKLCRVLKENHNLRDSTRFSHIESVAIFLYLIAQGCGYRNACERFQRPLSTIQNKFDEVLVALLGLTRHEIRADVNANVHSHITNSEMYYPHFQNCIGAIDGTHIAVTVPKNQNMPFISRKGTASQNVLGVCDFDMCFTFVSTGWEGSMHDSRILGTILMDAEAYNFPTPPEGKYYLVDSGYSNMKGYLAPYKGDRYHLPEFRNFDPCNANEVFNKHHASLRSVIERTFGVWKARFHILDNMPFYLFSKQAEIVAVTMALHNFIRRSSDTMDEFLEIPSNSPHGNEEVTNETPSTSSTQLMRADTYMSEVRDSIRHSICYM